jgi:hypothetical protein
MLAPSGFFPSLTLILAGAVTVLPNADPQQAGGLTPRETEERTLLHEVMFPAASKDVWPAILRLVADLGFKHELRDDANYVLVTKSRKYDRRRFPGREELGLPNASRPATIQLHISSTPHFEPARVVVGVVLDVEHDVGSQVTLRRHYRYLKLEQWFLERLALRVGAGPTPMSVSAEGRHRQAQRMRPAGLNSPCGLVHLRDHPDYRPPDVRGNPGRISGVGPERLSFVEPVFPASGFDDPNQQIALEASLTEHGTFTRLKVVRPADLRQDFGSSAIGAVSLWRYRPPLLDGCPVQAMMTVTVNYTVR